jgi:glycolate oxidase
VGAEKAQYMAEQFGKEDLETMARVRCAFDGIHLMNPGKVFPTPRLCGEKPGPYRPHPAETAGLAERW